MLKKLGLKKKKKGSTSFDALDGGVGGRRELLHGTLELEIIRGLNMLS